MDALNTGIQLDSELGIDCGLHLGFPSSLSHEWCWSYSKNLCRGAGDQMPQEVKTSPHPLVYRHHRLWLSGIQCLEPE